MPRPGHRPLRLALTFAAGCVGAALGLTVLALATAAFFRPDLGRPPVPPAGSAAGCVPTGRPFVVHLRLSDGDGQALTLSALP